MNFIIYLLSLFDRYNQKKILNYFKSKNVQYNIFFDVGAHKGETLKLFSNNFNIREFYCFEPSPINFEYLKKKKFQKYKKYKNF